MELFSTPPDNYEAHFSATEMMLARSHAGPPRGQPPAHTGSPVMALPPPMAEQSEDRTSEEIERGNTQFILQTWRLI